MDFFEIQAFYELSKTLHFSKAASIIHLSPSALSRLVMRLEDELGVQLLDRDTRQVQLTEDGKLFLRFAQDILHQKNMIENTFRERNESVSGNLRIYASVTACYTILPEFIEKISKDYPDIKLLVETGDPALAFKMLEDDGCDIAVSALPNERDMQKTVLADFETYPIKISPLVFVAKKDSVYAAFTKETIYKEAHFIIPKRGLARKRFDLATKHVPVHIAAETAGNEAVLALTALGLGLGLVPEIVLENGPFSQGLMAYPPEMSGLGAYSIGFVMKKNIRETHASFRLLQVARSIIESFGEV